MQIKTVMSKDVASDDHGGEETLMQRFLKAEEVIDCIESGKYATKDLQKRILDAIKILEGATRDVSSIGLFSSNETVDELPTSSLPYFLLPCYLGVFHHNVVVDVDRKPEELTMSKIYYKDYLNRVKEYAIVNLNLPWNDDEGEKDDEDDPFKPQTGLQNGKPAMTIEDHRQAKIQRFKMQQDFKAAMARARKIYNENNDDDGALRDLYMARLRYWAFKLIEEIASIDNELPILEMMIKRRQALAEGHEPAPDRLVPSAPLKPFIIARSEQQKKVLGLGYPSVPTMTVDEWYQQRFGNQPVQGPSNSAQKTHSHGADEECHSGSENEEEVNDEAKRLSQMRFDEYKDTHRRGWGNTHNKG